VPDDLQIPVPGPTQHSSAVSARYRPRRVGDDSTRWMTLAAVGLGGLMLLGMGGWALMGRKASEVPVIEADTRPLRVKPENPGGMQFDGADEAVMGGHVTGGNGMAPLAEVPAPQALRAQMQPAPATPDAGAGPSTAAPSAVPAPAAVPGTPAAPSGAPASATSGASPLPDTPVRPQALAKTAAAPAKPAASGTSGTLVQLAALETEAAAQAEWSKLSKRMPDLLGARQLALQRAERDGKTIWRVRTGGFSDTADASSFCVKVRAKGGSCTIAAF